MNRHLIRFVTLLLVPCLVADPASATVFAKSALQPTTSRMSPTIFQQEAVVGYLPNFVVSLFSRDKIKEIEEIKPKDTTTPAAPLLWRIAFYFLSSFVRLYSSHPTRLLYNVISKVSLPVLGLVSQFEWSHHNFNQYRIERLSEWGRFEDDLLERDYDLDTKRYAEFDPPRLMRINSVAQRSKKFGKEIMAGIRYRKATGPEEKIEATRRKLDEEVSDLGTSFLQRDNFFRYGANLLDAMHRLLELDLTEKAGLPAAALMPSPERPTSPRPALGALFGRGVALALLPAAFVSIVAISIPIKLSSPGPAWIRQERLGYKGKPITIWKLRTMTNGDDIGNRRVTRWGRFLRNRALDELPQLWSIVKGDMQWFGPRPALPRETSQEYIDRVLSQTKPGLMSSWVLARTLHLTNGDLLQAMIRSDLKDVSGKSFRHKLSLLWRTILVVFFGQRNSEPNPVYPPAAVPGIQALPNNVTMANRNDPRRLDGLKIGDATVRVFRNSEDYAKAFPGADAAEEFNKHWDRHYAIFEITNEELGYTAYMAVHRLTQIRSRDPLLDGQWRATGGTRIKKYPQGSFEALVDAMELSKEMSFKAAGAGLRIGGSKCAIHVTRINPSANGMDRAEREHILADYARALEQIGRLIGGGVFTGQDVNITKEDAKAMLPHAPTSIGPYSTPEYSIEPTPPTAVGVVAAMQAAIEQTDGKSDLNGKAIALQGLGGVGGLVLERLLKAGARVIASEVNPETIRNVEETFQEAIAAKQLYILPTKNANDIYNPLQTHPELRVSLALDHIDIFSPCAALNGVLNDVTIPQLHQAGVRWVVGSANDATKDRRRDPKLMQDLGIVYVPDYIANAGGLLGVNGHLGHAISDEAIAGLIARNVKELLARADREKKTPHEIADQQSRAFFEALPMAPLPPAAMPNDSTPIVIGDMLSSDREAVNKLYLETFAPKVAIQGSAAQHDKDWTITLVARAGAKIAGYTAADLLPQSGGGIQANLGPRTVAPAYEGKGIGKELFLKMLDRLRANPEIQTIRGTIVSLDIRSRARTQKLLEEQGFQQKPGSDAYELDLRRPAAAQPAAYDSRHFAMVAAIRRMKNIAADWEQKHILLSADKWTKAFEHVTQIINKAIRSGAWDTQSKRWRRRWYSLIASSDFLESLQTGHVLNAERLPDAPLRKGDKSYSVDCASPLGTIHAEIDIRTNPLGPQLRITFWRKHPHATVFTLLNTLLIGSPLRNAEELATCRLSHLLYLEIIDRARRKWIHTLLHRFTFSDSDNPNIVLSTFISFLDYLQHRLDASASVFPPTPTIPLGALLMEHIEKNNGSLRSLFERGTSDQAYPHIKSAITVYLAYPRRSGRVLVLFPEDAPEQWGTIPCPLGTRISVQPYWGLSILSTQQKTWLAQADSLIAEELQVDPKTIDIDASRLTSVAEFSTQLPELIVRKGRQVLARLVYQIDENIPHGAGISIFPRQFDNTASLSRAASEKVPRYLQAFALLRHQAKTYYVSPADLTLARSLESAGLVEEIPNPNGWPPDSGFPGAWFRVHIDRIQMFLDPPRQSPAMDRPQVRRAA